MRSRELVASVVSRLLDSIGLELNRKGVGERLQGLQARSKKLEQGARQSGAMLAWLQLVPNLRMPDQEWLDYLPDARSQLGQDLFALFCSNFKKRGFFLEIGATDGQSLSNTWILEKRFGWSGLLVEPARRWHGDLFRNRSCSIDTRAVWPSSDGSVGFYELAMSSAVAPVAKSEDKLAARREYEVATVHPVDLLKAHQVPKRIDFLSLDTEGSELQILESFPFNNYEVLVACIEHNFRPDRGDIEALMESQGFTAVLGEVSKHDTWFVADKVLRKRRMF